MPDYRFRLINVFAESPMAGNPLCVFEDARGLDEDTMLALARQFNLSETTFVLPSAQADARVRIFTPTGELRFAGHPAIGTAQVVRDLLGGERQELRFAFDAGIVPVVATGDIWTFTAPVEGAPRSRVPAMTPHDICALFSLRPEDLLDRPMWLDTGSEQLLIPLKHPDAVARAAPDGSRLPSWEASGTGRRSAYLYAFEQGLPQHPPVSPGHRHAVQARFFFMQAGGGVGEDPGTGSACANLGGWWLASGLAPPVALRIAQGAAVHRPCRLDLDVGTDGSIRVGGQAREIGHGVISL